MFINIFYRTTQCFENFGSVNMQMDVHFYRFFAIEFILMNMFLLFCCSDLVKVLYMNAQYLIVYECQANLQDTDSDTGVSCANADEVKVYGRTSLMSSPVKRMLSEIVKLRTCAVIDSLSAVKTNGLYITFQLSLFDNHCINSFLICSLDPCSLLVGVYFALNQSTT